MSVSVFSSEFVLGSCGQSFSLASVVVPKDPSHHSRACEFQEVPVDGIYCLSLPKVG